MRNWIWYIDVISSYAVLSDKLHIIQVLSDESVWVGSLTKPVKMETRCIITFLLICKCFFLAAQQDYQPYCFEFTWLGPLVNKDSVQNVDCTAKAYSAIPCKYPIVITDNSLEPDTNVLWEKYKDNYTCPLQTGFACLKYTYSYNNAILNITYFCGKVVEDRTTPLTSGCYSQKLDGTYIEACACRTSPGRAPCNLSIKNIPSPILILIGISVFLYNILLS